MIIWIYYTPRTKFVSRGIILPLAQSPFPCSRYLGEQFYVEIMCTGLEVILKPFNVSLFGNSVLSGLGEKSPIVVDNRQSCLITFKRVI